jgi:hypothetical protein
MTVSLARIRIVLVGLVLLAGAAATTLTLSRAHHRAGAAQQQAFTVALPAHWHELTAAQLKALSKPAVAAYARDDGTALVTIRRAGAAPVISADFVHSLDQRFRSRLSDYVPVSARVITTKAGGAFFFSYVRRNLGTLDTIVLVPAGKQSYLLDSVSNPGSLAATHDVGRIINTFDPR